MKMISMVTPCVSSQDQAVFVTVQVYRVLGLMGEASLDQDISPRTSDRTSVTGCLLACFHLRVEMRFMID